MYYLISEDNGQLLELFETCPGLTTLQEMAREYECGFWIIEGQHSGITIEYPIAPEPDPEPVTSSPKIGYVGCRFCGGRGCIACEGELRRAVAR